MVKPYIMTLLSDILSSKIRAEIFRLLFGLNLDALHVREIERRSGFTIGTIQTELKKLSSLGLVHSRRDGNRLYYRANQQHEIFKEIQILTLKTVGLADILKSVLVDENAIAVAFIFGSIARQAEKPGSDIDLMVIGNLGLRQISSHLSAAVEKIGREINPYILSAAEFKSRKEKKEHFLSRVLSEPRIFIIGNEDDIKAMA
jgi:DNA-binding transcriptional ArsR family regulator